MRGERGLGLVELVVVLAVLAAAAGMAAPTVGTALAAFRVHGATADLYGAIHLTRARARATNVMHALVLEADGRAFRIVEDPGGASRTVIGPVALVEGVVASGNTTLRFSPKGFAVPFGTITVRGEAGQVRRLIVNIVGRVRVAAGEPPG